MNVAEDEKVVKKNVIRGDLPRSSAAAVDKTKFQLTEYSSGQRSTSLPAFPVAEIGIIGAQPRSPDRKSGQ